MSIWRAVVVGVGGGATLLVACTSGTTSTGGGGGGDSQSFINDYCGTVAPCCAQVNKPTDGASCRTLYTALTSAYTYDATLGSMCLSELHAAQGNPDFCMTFGKTGASCKGVFKEAGSANGTKAPGETCNSTSDCTSSPEGDVSCALNFSGTAETKTCQVEIHGKENDKPCNQTKDGNTTYGVSSSSGAPAAPPPKAYSCDVADGLYCNDKTQTCTKIQGAGGPCESFSSYACTKDTYCDYATKKCVVRTPIGGDCSKAGSGCVDKSYCTSDTHLCTAQRPVGATCKSSQECESDRCVNTKCDSGTASSASSLALLCGGK